MLDFFKKLLPNFEKRRLVTSVENTIATLQNNVLLSVEIVRVYQEQHNHKQLESKLAVTQSKDLYKALNRLLPSHAFNSISITYNELTNLVVEKVVLLRKYVDDLFSPQIATNGLTFKQVEIIRLLDLANFYADYVMKSISLMVWQHSHSKGQKTADPLLPGELKWLEQNYNNFLQLAAILAKDIKEFENIIKNTSEIEVVEVDNANVIGTTSDPFRLGFMPVIGTGILFIGKLWLEYEHNRYEKNKLRYQSVQLQIQLLKQLDESGEADESVKRQIEYYTNLAKDYEAKIKAYEEKAGV